jgi:sphinganine-1-phosphate aldolase
VPEVYILGKPLVSVVAFGSEVVDILEVGDRLSKKGWHCAFVSPVPLR